MAVSETTREQVRRSFNNHCAYCQIAQRHYYNKLEIEHILPKVLGGTDDSANLCLACRLCNSNKGERAQALDPMQGIEVPLFNPRTQVWTEHFEWRQDGIAIIGLTSIGRATVEALQLNNPIALTVRRYLVIAGWHPPMDMKQDTANDTN